MYIFPQLLPMTLFVCYFVTPSEVRQGIKPV